MQITAQPPVPLPVAAAAVVPTPAPLQPVKHAAPILSSRPVEPNAKGEKSLTVVGNHKKQRPPAGNDHKVDVTV